MKSSSVRKWLLLFAIQSLLFTGCTTALWNEETFARHYRPANPVNLRLFYSSARQDILVRYDESRNIDDTIRNRSYWLERNRLRVNENRKPHFVSPKPADDLIPISVSETASNSAQPGFAELHAVARGDGDSFTLYLGNEPLDPEKLPTYTGHSQKIKQVLLTPFAVGIDATIFGAVAAYYGAPNVLGSLNR